MNFFILLHFILISALIVAILGQRSGDSVSGFLAKGLSDNNSISTSGIETLLNRITIVLAISLVFTTIYISKLYYIDNNEFEKIAKKNAAIHEKEISTEELKKTIKSVPLDS